MKYVPIILDILCFIGGSIITSYYSLRFMTYSNIVSINAPEVGLVYLKVQEPNIIMITIGVGLIVLGFLIRGWYKKEK